LRLFFSLIVVFGLGAGSAAAAAWNKLVTPAQLSALIGAGGATVLDIRSPKAYGASHVAGALNAPYGSHSGDRSLRRGRESRNAFLRSGTGHG
jgi:thiosulfate/3-mercaptopyruvate sulfurtransferase